MGTYMYWKKEGVKRWDFHRRRGEGGIFTNMYIYERVEVVEQELKALLCVCKNPKSLKIELTSSSSLP